MKNSAAVFSGFSNGIFSFLTDLKKHNNVEWFHKNKECYQNFVVEPSKAFVTEMQPFLNRLNPAIRTEPKFNKTIMRINKDMRFAKGEPYRNYWLIHFGRFKLDSEFFLYFEAGSAEMGIFINRSQEGKHCFQQNLEKYKKEIREVCAKYKINGNYSFYYFAKMEPTKLIAKFDAEKHFDKFYEYEMFLLQSVKPVAQKVLFSNTIVIEMIKMILCLYPLYCFAISPQPLKELRRFEDEFGEVV
ncbi:MAG: hypothetical protein FD143_1720 [Ignavibacteria bacterium]|nr:MAG: hypothetical protein FD143_1720 [Ignavibacteria bacterium]KAF0160068.1 MAG: hypothetical protein FD188_1882 [Ignavibacteria bacterium]